MTKDFRHITIVAVLGLMLLVAGGIIGRLSVRQPVTNCNQLPDTVRLERIYTAWLSSVPDTVTLTKTKFVPVPVYVRDTDTIVEEVMVPLPFEQHEITVEDVAKVWVNGYQVIVDSAVAYRHVLTEIIRQPYEVKPPPNLVMVQAGITDASLTYMHRLGRSVWLGASAGSTYTGVPSARASIGFQF